MPYREHAKATADEWQIVVGFMSGYGYAKNPILRFFVNFFWGLIRFLPLGEYLREQIQALFGHYSIEKAFNLWRMDRAKKEMPFVTGFVEYRDVLYTSKKGKKWVSASEPVAVLNGSRNPLHDKDENTYRSCVLELAKTLGRRFGQSRVYATVLDETFILQNDEISRK